AFVAMYDAMTIASPTHLNALPGLELRTKTAYTTVPEYRDYLARYADVHRLAIERAAVERVERTRDGFVVNTALHATPAHAVVVATGMWDFPHRVSFDGLTAPVIHARDWCGAAARTEERILVVGGATSAIEIAEDVARTKG